METRAAKEAIARSGIDPQEIDLVLGYTSTPDYMGAPTACLVHHNLGLSERCFSTEINAVCNALPLQLALAEQMIKGGRAHYALLLQSSLTSVFLSMEDPISAWFGDGATAAVVGPVSEGKGLLASTHRTYGEYHTGLILGVPGDRWYVRKPVLYSADPKIGRAMILKLAELSKEVVTDALDQAGATRDEVGFYASHQATPWLRRVTQEHIGLKSARFVDTFPWTGSLLPCNAPLQLAVAEREGLLKDGDLVATFTGGGGTTCSGTVLRWGR
jgi:3-oxoacyl-[acyl-carrier-protein] synthase-3